MRRKLFVRRCNGGSLPELLVSLKKLRGLQAFVLSAEGKGGQGWMVVNKSVPFLVVLNVTYRYPIKCVQKTREPYTGKVLGFFLPVRNVFPGSLSPFIQAIGSFLLILPVTPDFRSLIVGFYLFAQYFFGFFELFGFFFGFFHSANSTTQFVSNYVRLVLDPISRHCRWCV